MKQGHVAQVAALRKQGADCSDLLGRQRLLAPDDFAVVSGVFLLCHTVLNNNLLTRAFYAIAGIMQCGFGKAVLVQGDKAGVLYLLINKSSYSAKNSLRLH